LLVPDAAWQSTCAGPVVIRCNFTVLTIVVTLLNLRTVLAIVSDNCFVLGILRGAFWCASFVMFFSVHPSGCFCASFEMPFSVHPSRCFWCVIRVWGLRVELGLGEGCARGVSGKTSPPFLAGGSSRLVFRSLWCASGNMCLGFFRKKSPLPSTFLPKVRWGERVWEMHETSPPFLACRRPGRSL